MCYGTAMFTEKLTKGWHANQHLLLNWLVVGTPAVVLYHRGSSYDMGSNLEIFILLEGYTTTTTIIVLLFNILVPSSFILSNQWQHQCIMC